MGVDKQSLLIVNLFVDLQYVQYIYLLVDLILIGYYIRTIE